MQVKYRRNRLLLTKDKKLHPSCKPWVKEQLNMTKCCECGVDFKLIKEHNIHIHHKDHNPTNNEFSNFDLLCVTCHLKYHKRGNRNNNNFTLDEASEICEAYSTGLYTQKYIASYLGVCLTSVSNLIRRNR